MAEHDFLPYVKDIPEEVAKKAMKPLTRMLELAK